MDKQHEKQMLDLQRLMQAANLKTEADYDRFIKEMSGKTIPVFDKEALNTEEQAQDLVYQASEEDNMIVSDQLVYKALQLDPNCVEAYEYLGDMADGPLHSLVFYQSGYLAARKKLGEKYVKENKGHFWGLHETRPFMRCLKNYAECLYILDQKQDALDVYFELLDLNPNDNQGVRDYAGIYCLELGNQEEFLALHNQYNEDATAFHYYNFALYSFITHGDAEESRMALAAAREVNKHVLQLLLSKKAMPELPDHYGFGDKNEAIFYAIFSKNTWYGVPGAIAWLERVYLKK